MPRVLLPTTDAYGALGGIAQYNRDLALAISSHPGIDEVVLVPRNVTSAVAELPPKVRQDSTGAGSIARFALALARHATVPELAGVLCGHVNLLPFAATLAVARGAPLGLMLYGIEVWQPPTRRVVVELARRVRHVASISQITRDRFEAWAGRNAHSVLVPNAIDIESYAPGPKSPELVARYRLEGADPILLTLARLAGKERYKGFDEMIEVLPRLIERYPGLRYIIAGDGDDRARLESKVGRAGLASRVIFTGRVAEQEKQDHYRLADVFVMPGRGEGFGFVFLEALACGVPVVASQLDGSREAVRDGMLGELCDPRVPDSIVAAVEAALRRPHGAAPQGLSYFDFPHFEARVHAWLDIWLRPA